MSSEENSHTSRPSFSFGFAKKKEKNTLKESVLNTDKNDGQEEKDYVISMEGRSVNSTKPKEEKEELIIPLIEYNRWKGAVKPEDLEKAGNNSDQEAGKKFQKVSGNDADAQAVNELLEETIKTKDSDEKKEEKIVPILMRNQIPNGFETDENLDVSLRPETSVEADYEEVPIEAYGLAMLRGMGWKKGEAFGKHSGVAKPIEAVARPKGLGLGADRSQQKQAAGATTSADDAGTEELQMKKGGYCLVMSGRHKDLYGQIEGTDEENARVYLKLTISGDKVEVTQYAVKLVTEKEYKKQSKYLNKAKVDKYKEEQERKNKRGSERENDTDRDRHRDRGSNRDREDHRHRDKDSHRDRDSHKDRDSHRDREDYRHREKNRDNHKNSHKHRENDEASSNGDRSSRHSDRDGRTSHKDERKRKHNEDRDKSDRKKHKEEKSNISSKSNLESTRWLQPHIRVRIIDPKYKKGKYYKSKVIVDDVVTLDTCVCKTDDGKVLEDINQSMLETVIPKTDPSYVLITKGKERKQLGEILKRDKDTCLATVQLLKDREKLLELDYDSICEYVGDIDNEFDY